MLFTNKDFFSTNLFDKPTLMDILLIHKVNVPGDFNLYICYFANVIFKDCQVDRYYSTSKITDSDFGKEEVQGSWKRFGRSGKEVGRYRNLSSVSGKIFFTFWMTIELNKKCTENS